jgi:hypothetical protein
LAAPGRAPEIPESLDVYGWLVGSWALEVVSYRDADLTGRGVKGEAHFGWVLEGRAIQDVWIIPLVEQRRSAIGPADFTYGTTFRAWTPSIQAWRITWINPVTGHREEQIGRWSGKDIVQTGTRADGTLTRWSYSEITPNSFRWLGEALNPDGRTWKVEAEFRATRMR